MVAGAEFDSLVVEAELTPSKITEIFERRRESAKLDYKLLVDPSSRRDAVELTKDVVAMANSAGGYILVGVRDDSTEVGIPDELLARIDETTIRAQTGSYLATAVDLFVNKAVKRDGRRFAILTILRSRQSPLVFARDGQYTDGNRTVAVFRQGDVFVRHGSASERWNQDDVRTLYSRVVEREKERWLSGVLPDVRRLIEAAGKGETHAPNPTELLLADAESFEKRLRGRK